MTEIIEIKMTSEQEEGTKSVLSTWLKKVGEHVKEHEPLIEVTTDKVSLEISSPASGILIEVIKVVDEDIHPGEILGRIQLSDASSASTPTTSKEKNASKTKSASSNDDSSRSTDAALELTPAVKRLLKEKGISATDVKGTGPRGRILIEDIENFHQSHKPAASTTAAGESTRIPHNQMRKSIASHMVQSLLHTAPHVTSVFDCDLTEVIKHRDAHKEEFAKKGVKLTLTPYFIQATVKALKAVPQLNSRWHDDSLELFPFHNIGLAIGLEQGGLIVPVIKNAADLDLFQIASLVQELTQKARTQTLDPKEVRDGTFTISNHGMTGSLIATPIIINQPQSGILGIGKLEKRVIVKEVDGKDQMVIRPMVYVSLTLDHRVLDGVQANAFLTTFVASLEDAHFYN
jgi:2-oxoglutarate dehydrogenase E2 component (dihydrolipoamide succinyltransferase)